MPVTLRALTSRTGLRRVLLAYALVEFVEFLLWLATMLWAYGERGAGFAGLVALAQLIPAALLSPLLAGVGDRLPRSTALVLAHGFLAVSGLLSAVVLAIDAPAVVIIVVTGFATTAVAVVRPIHFASLPQLSASPDELVSANMLSSMAEGFMRFLGSVAAGFLVAAFSVAFTFGVAGIACTVATLLCLGLRLDGGESHDDEESEGLRAALDGLRALSGDWPAIALLVVMAVDFLFVGALDVLGVPFSIDVLHRDQAGAGLILGSMGIGALVGAVVGGDLARRRVLSPVILVGGLLGGLGVAAVALFSGLPPVMAVLAIAGAGGAMVLISGRTLLQRSIDDRVLARVFAVQESLALIATAIGSVVAPVLIAALGASSAFVPFGLAGVLIALAGFLFVRRLDARSRYLPVELGLLRGVPILAVLPPYELERMARHARWIDVAAGVDVIVQGDVGDEFFVVASGSFVASVDGVQREAPMGAGDSFGEVALLRAVPRTATVRCVQDGRLLMLAAPHFLAAVQGSVDGVAIAAEVSAGHLARDAARD